MIIEPLSEQIIRKIDEVEEQYYRLILVVAPANSGKTTALRDVRDRTDAPLFNVNLELSKRMLELTERQRILQLPRLLQEIVGNRGSKIILLDNIEVIFDVELKQDPLRLLQGLSRNRSVVAAWNGTIVENSLTYADPSHPEYRRYSVRDFLVVTPETTK